MHLLCLGWPLRWQASSHRYSDAHRSVLYLMSWYRYSGYLRLALDLWELACQRRGRTC